MLQNLKKLHNLTKTVQRIQVKGSSSSNNTGQRTVLDEKAAFNLLLNLNEEERAILKASLEKLAIQEGNNASTRWRCKYPIGMVCAIPSDFSKNKGDEYDLEERPPKSSDLWRLFLVNAVPFAGFGFLDNFIMICSGDYIEHLFGTVFLLSIMAAAALGNTISDVIGIGSTHYIEKGCEKLGLVPPKLSVAQIKMKSSRRYSNLGRVFGITFGCLAGMCPLLFLDLGDEKGK